MGLNESDLFMELLPRNEWRMADKEQLEERVREVLLRFPGISFSFTQPIQMRVSEMLTGATGDVSIKIFGEDLAVLAELVQRSARLAQQVEGAVDVQASITEGGKFLAVRARGEAAADRGLSAESLANALKAQLEGTRVTEIVEGRRRTPVLFAPDDDGLPRAASAADFVRREVLLPDGTLAPLAAVADVSYEEGPLLIQRESGDRFGAITLNVSGRDILGFVEELDAVLRERAPLPPGYRFVFGGEFENQQRATRDLSLVIPVALLLILIILFTTFRSMARAALILGNIPFALMGGVIALFLSGEYLSVPASVGLIALLGVAVLNGVVMLSYFEQLRPVAASLDARILDGAVQRLRPILMTASTAMFGLLPLVFTSGPGAEVQRPLAIVVIGGLFTSTATTLYLLPMAYRFLERRHG
jgi:cobalt-zinc-cadmium resistance protein CzcA